VLVVPAGQETFDSVSRQRCVLLLMAGTQTEPVPHPPPFWVVAQKLAVVVHVGGPGVGVPGGGQPGKDGGVSPMATTKTGPTLVAVFQLGLRQERPKEYGWTLRRVPAWSVMHSAYDA